MTNSINKYSIVALNQVVFPSFMEQNITFKVIIEILFFMNSKVIQNPKRSLIKTFTPVLMDENCPCFDVISCANCY